MEAEDIAPNMYLYTADPVGVGRKSREYMLFSSLVYRHDFLPIYRLDQHVQFVPTYMFLAKYPPLPFGVLIYLNLWRKPTKCFYTC